MTISKRNCCCLAENLGIVDIELMRSIEYWSLRYDLTSLNIVSTPLINGFQEMKKGISRHLNCTCISDSAEQHHPVWTEISISNSFYAFKEPLCFAFVPNNLPWKISNMLKRPKNNDQKMQSLIDWHIYSHDLLQAMVNFSNGAAQGIMNEKEIPISLPSLPA